MEEKKGTVVALGGFDGLHRAHMKIINRTKEYAENHKLKSGVLLFDKLPIEVFSEKARHIMMLEDKEELLDFLDFVYVQQFSADFRALSGEEFACFLKEKLNVEAVCAGFNYKFGKNASSDVNSLKQYGEKYGFDVIIEEEYKISGEAVSSTKIRQMIEDGNMKKASSFLGRDFFITGEVKNGYHLGRTLGFPTVNVAYEKNIVLPKFGVYSGRTEVEGKSYRSVINVGKRPTFSRDDVTVEAFLLDFNGDLYEKKIRVYFEDYIRMEIKFSNAEKLKEQINKDIERVK